MGNVGLYHDKGRELQDRFDTRRLADRIEDRIVRDHIDDDDRAFIEARDMFFIATVDADGQPQSSYKGGEPGFVRVLDGRTIAFPVYDGNGMYLTAGNLLQTGKVGLLFIDFEGRKRLRLNGVASVDDDDPLRGEYPEAQLVVRVAAHETPPALLEPEARALLLQRTRHLAGPPPAGEGTGCELPAPLTILGSERDGEACVVAPITVGGRQVLRPQLPRLDLCGVHLLPPDAACSNLRRTSGPDLARRSRNPPPGVHQKTVLAGAQEKGRPCGGRPFRLFATGLRLAGGGFFLRLSVEMP